MPADPCSPGGPLMLVRNRGPLTPRRPLLNHAQQEPEPRPGEELAASPVVSSFARTAAPVRLRVRAAEAESLVRGGVLQEAGGPLDRGAALWVSKRQLRALGLYHREWVWLHDVTGGRSHLALILATAHPLSSALISASLSFNLGLGSSASEVLIQRYSPEPSEGSRSALQQPPFARTLHIDAVPAPSYSTQAAHQQALRQHFTTPRVVQVGDILCVAAVSHADFLHSKATLPLRCPDLYYKVRRIDGQDGESGGYLADTAHTTLYQEGVSHSFIPSSPSRDAHVFWSSLSPAGLTHIVEDVCRLLHPHLQDTSHVLGAPGRILLSGPAGSGKVTVVRAACSRLNLHLYQVECARLCRESSAGSVARLRSLFSRARECRPCVLLLCHVDLLGRERDGSGEDTRVISTLCSLLLDSTDRDWPMLVVATSCRTRDLPLDLQSCFLHELPLQAPSEEERLAMLTALTAPLPLSREVNVRQLARRTAGLVVRDLCSLLTGANRRACARNRHSGAVTEEAELPASGFLMTSQDLEEALSDLQDAHSQAIGAPKVPTVRWKDVGGLHEAKRQLLDTVQLPLEHPEMLSLGLRRSGVLLYGPPGTGKTLLAKAVATECAMTFLSVKGPELINMYVGQSEENVREVFSRARAAAPCIIFFDELDSLAPNRGRSGDSGGVMDRVVSQLLAEMDGLHSSNDVFVIGATNRPDLLDSALLRPGRFDKLVYVGVNEDRDSQLKVLEAVTRRFSLDPSVELALVLDGCPITVTGADLYALAADAMMSAIKEKVQRLQEGGEALSGELVVGMDHFLQAAARLQPSVTQQELQRYEKIRAQFSGQSGHG